MSRVLAVHVLRSDSSSLALLASARILIPSSSASSSPETPSNYDIISLVSENVRMHFNNTGKMDLPGLTLHFRVSAPFCFVAVTESELLMNAALEFLSTAQGLVMDDPHWAAQLAVGDAALVEAQLEVPLTQLMMAENNRQHPQTQKMSQLQEQVDQVKSVMTNNVQMILERGEALETMQARSDQLAATSESFKTTARRVQRKMCMLNAKWTIIAVVGIILLVTIIVLIICKQAGAF